MSDSSLEGISENNNLVFLQKQDWVNSAQKIIKITRPLWRKTFLSFFFFQNSEKTYYFLKIQSCSNNRLCRGGQAHTIYIQYYPTWCSIFEGNLVNNVTINAIRSIYALIEVCWKWANICSFATKCLLWKYPKKMQCRFEISNQSEIDECEVKH